MSINAIDISKLRNSEFLQFSKDVLGIVSLNNPTTLQVKTQYDDFENITSTIESLFKSERGSIITNEIADLDARRDTAITGINTFIQALTYHFDEPTRKNAELLTKQLGNYGSGIAKENYQSETAIITSILNDWTTKPDLAAAITALNLTNWKTELENANSEFNTKYLARTQELGAASLDTIKQKRLEAANIYYKLRDFINSYYTLNDGAAPYGKTVNELNALIDQYNVLLAGRKLNNTNTSNNTPTPSN